MKLSMSARGRSALVIAAAFVAYWLSNDETVLKTPK
jgi:hypothetical protein